MHCLNGCRNPCNAAFRGEGKYSLRFSRLTPDDAKILLEFAALYAVNIEGDVPETDWPEGLRGKLTARTPPKVLRV
jgi:predicted metal-binding protein